MRLLLIMILVVCKHFCNFHHHLHLDFPASCYPPQRIIIMMKKKHTQSELYAYVIGQKVALTSLITIIRLRKRKKYQFLFNLCTIKYPMLTKLNNSYTNMYIHLWVYALTYYVKYNALVNFSHGSF